MQAQAVIRWLVNRWPIMFAGWLPLPPRNRRGWWKPTKAGNPRNEWQYMGRAK